MKKAEAQKAAGDLGCKLTTAGTFLQKKTSNEPILSLSKTEATEINRTRREAAFNVVCTKQRSAW